MVMVHVEVLQTHHRIPADATETTMSLQQGRELSTAQAINASKIASFRPMLR